MTISLGERSPETVAIYHEKSDCARVREALPQKARTLEEALEDYRASLRPGAASYGRTILIDGRYAGDVWCYGIDPGAEPEAMLGYCVLDEADLNRGVASEALRLFLPEASMRYGIRRFGAFTYADNRASRRVLERNGFALAERFAESDRESCYYEKTLEPPRG